jgi:hypothetical protein
MALTTATFADAPSGKQPGTLGRLRARRGTITFTSGYDSTTGVTVTGRSVGLNEIVAIIAEGAANTGAGIQAALASGNATVTLYDGTTKVATSDQSLTTVPVIVLGF